MPHQLDGLEAGCTVVAAENKPFVLVGGFAEMELSTSFLFAEMREAGGRKCLAPHKAVTRATCPTGLNRQASHAMTKANKRTDNIRIAQAKTVGVFAFDADGVISTVRLAGELDNRIEKPPNAAFADLVIAGLEREVIGDRAIGAGTQTSDGFGKKFGPGIVAVIHASSINRGEGKCNFVLSFWLLRINFWLAAPASFSFL